MSEYLLKKREKIEDSVYVSVLPQISPLSASYILYANSTFTLSLALGTNLMNDAIYKYSNNVDKDRVIDTSISLLPFNTFQQNSIGNVGNMTSPLIVVEAMAFVPAYYAGYLVKEKEVYYFYI